MKKTEPNKNNFNKIKMEQTSNNLTLPSRKFK